MAMHWSEPAFWFAAWQIILINFVLSGDNAVVIALACRSLPRRQRVCGMVFGACAAVLLRIAFVMIITAIMDFPLLKLAGGILLLWIAIKLVVPAVSHAQENVAAAGDLWNAVKIVAVADVVMSLDNVIAIAAAAKGSWLLIIFGLAVSVPLIVAGSALLVSVLDRYPIASWGGAALLGWIAGQIIIEDPAVAGWIREPGDAIALVAAGLGAGPAGATHVEALQYGAATAGAAFVATVGHFVARRRRSHPSHGAGEDAAISDEPRIDPAVASRDRAG
jgi:YjbE family integral membrane protein